MDFQRDRPDVFSPLGAAIEPDLAIMVPISRDRFRVHGVSAAIRNGPLTRAYGGYTVPPPLTSARIMKSLSHDHFAFADALSNAVAAAACMSTSAAWTTGSTRAATARSTISENGRRAGDSMKLPG